MGVYLFVCLLYLFFLYTDCLPSNLCTVKLLRVIKECLILFGFNIFQNLPDCIFIFPILIWASL